MLHGLPPAFVCVKCWVDSAHAECSLRLVFSSSTGRNAPRSLAVIWSYATRLETRTKESDAYASLRVTETLRHNESKRDEIYPLVGAHHQPTYSALRKV